ncbi:hypothetical protein MUK42_37153 [Musa troglodytarum]|uniref:Uncharacterized protein n=1 Tax=Musa troglodytarum TaxID=320322 RepID=A0A9E7H998_9LILI|nr:hypothetical protein MUK42_37153 [Musa troglodytarum]
MDALARSKKVRTNGSVKTKEKAVCASFALRREKNVEVTGNLAAWNSDRRRHEMVSRTVVE